MYKTCWHLNEISLPKPDVTDLKFFILSNEYNLHCQVHMKISTILNIYKAFPQIIQAL